jgi:hypothetical protein
MNRLAVIAIQLGGVSLIDVLVKVLLLAFALAVGGCFAIWPGEVIRRFDIWGGRNARAATTPGPNTSKYAERHALRQMGIWLFVLTCYMVYLWIRTG